MPKMTADEIKSFMQKIFPQARMPVEIEELCATGFCESECR